MATYTSAVVDGLWSNSNSWSPVAPAGGPSKFDDVILTGGNHIIVDVDIEIGPDNGDPAIQIQANTILKQNSGTTIELYGAMILEQSGRFQGYGGVGAPCVVDQKTLGAYIFHYKLVGGSVSAGVHFKGASTLAGDRNIIRGDDVGMVFYSQQARYAYAEMEYVDVEPTALTQSIGHYSTTNSRIHTKFTDVDFKTTPSGSGYVDSANVKSFNVFEWEDVIFPSTNSALYIALGVKTTSGTIVNSEFTNNHATSSTLYLSQNANTLIMRDCIIRNLGIGPAFTPSTDGGVSQDTIQKFYGCEYYSGGPYLWDLDKASVILHDYGSVLKLSDINQGTMSNCMYSLFKKKAPTILDAGGAPVENVSLFLRSGNVDPATSQPYSSTSDVSDSNGEPNDDMYVGWVQLTGAGEVYMSDGVNKPQLVLSRDPYDQWSLNNVDYSSMGSPILLEPDEDETFFVYLKDVAQPVPVQPRFITPFRVRTEVR